MCVEHLIKKYEYLTLLMLNAIEAFLFAVFKCVHFETNDDEWISDITSGVLGYRESRIRYLNTIYLKLVITLGNFFPKRNWHGIIMFFTVFVSFSCIVYVVFKLKSRMQRSYIFFLVLIYLVGISFYLKLQFTRTSAIGIVAGLMLIVYSYRNATEKKRYLLYAVGGMLFLWASLIRFDNVYAIGLIYTPCFLSCVFYSFNNKKFLKLAELCLVMGCCFCFLFGSRIYNNVFYKSEDYKKWEEFDISRSELMDFGWPEYIDYEEFYKDEGISENSYMNYVLWDLEDQDFINIDSLRRVIKQKEYSILSLSGNSLKKIGPVVSYFGKIIIPKFLKYPFFWFFLISIVLLAVFGYDDINVLSGTLCAFLLVQLILSYIQRGANERVDAGLFLAMITVVILCANDIAKRTNVVPLFLITFFLLVGTITICKDQIFESQRQESLRSKQTIVRLSCEDKENVYLTPELDRVPLSFNPFEAFPVGYASNYITYGGWITGSPLKEYQKKKNGINNMYRDIVDREDSYLVLMDQNLDLKLEYYREHYGEDINAILTRRIAGVHMYRIVHGDEIKLPNDDEFVKDNSLKCAYEKVISEDGFPMIMGSAVVNGANSYTQKVYLGIPNKDGSIDYHSTVQIVLDENIEINNGRYSSFIYVDDEGELDNFNVDDIVLLYENESLRFKNK